MAAPNESQTMWGAIIRNMPSRTGKTLEEWIEIVRAQDLTSRKERVAWLKQEHGITHVYAQIIAEEAGKSPDYVEPAPEDLLAGQYSGAKAALMPIYERLVTEARSLGDDVEVLPRQTYVALSRRRQFAVIQPSTRDRVDLGLSLNGTPASGRLQTSTNFGSGRTTHRVAIKVPEEIDAQVVGWLRAAYEGG
jgi:hypothetical protein